MKKSLSNREIAEIKDHAQKAFNNTPQFLDLDPKEMQIACILMGFQSFLNKNGMVCEFEVRLKEHHDSSCLDDLTPSGG